MIKNAFSRLARHFTRRGESGQAIIILALGFIALIAFVGIVTDVSLMFVRYSTLSRAVDAAAIAAAGQMRSDRNFGEVGLAARQFIEFHGLNPVEVLVQTCQTADMVDHDNDPATDPVADPSLCPEDQRKLVRVSARVKSPTIFMRLLGFSDIELSAVAISETAVLDVVVIMDVSESMLFETTYDDWSDIGMGKVYVPPRMGGNNEPTAIINAGGTVTGYNFSAADNNTIFKNEFLDQFNGTDEGRGADGNGVWLPNPADPEDPPIIQKFWDDFVIPDIQLQQDINDRLFYTTGGSEGFGSNTPDPDYTVQVYDYPVGSTQISPRFECRVRFWPFSSAIPVEQPIRDVYTAVGANWTQSNWDGFIPTFNFYGCCNDPTDGGQIDESGALVPMEGASINYQGKDNRFNDLICQPFKQARDATRQFIDRIDFARGDRLAFVTFDRGSFLIDPDGSQGFEVTDPADPLLCPGEVPIDHDDDPGTPTRSGLTHMIESECRALRTLDKDIGVRAEPNFYDWNDQGGGWLGYADGTNPDGQSLRVDYTYRANDVQDTSPTGRGYKVYNNYPVKDNCPLQNGALAGLRSKYSLWTRGDYAQFGSAEAGLYRTMIPTPYEGAWAGNGLTIANSYELRASCRGTNMGAALRAGSNALLDPSTTRRTGTVWVMVLLSDGAAGASDPVRQNGRKLSVGKVNGDINSDIGPYADKGPDPQVNKWENWGINPGTGQPFERNIRYGTVNPGERTEYGAFGLCPLGTPGAPTRLTRNINADPNDNNAIHRKPVFPFCSDVQPESRHFCLPPDAKPSDITFNEDEVGGDCSDVPVLNEKADGSFLAGFRPAAKDMDYNCNPSDLGMHPDFPNETIQDYNLRKGNIYDVDIGNWAGNAPTVTNDCDPLYDVDDYARDWADYIGLSRGTGDQQLPSIFTIGFGLNFPYRAGGGTSPIPPTNPAYVPGPAEWNIPDYLGEELLRYIADVGDNFEIDTDYQQDWRDDGLLNDSLNGAYGLRGPCESPVIPAGAEQPYISPLPPRTNCGNYYNAPDQAQLELVFNDIASRMFTRLTG